MNSSRDRPRLENPGPPAPVRVLVVDDDVELGELLSEYLGAAGFAVEGVHEPEEGVERALSGEHAVVVLDVMLPRMDGFEVLRRIRARSAVPVLMLTARGDDVDRIVGLELGADDYLHKPFNPRELVARLHAILRRVRPGEAGLPVGERLVVGDVELDPGSRQVHCGGRALELTSAEFTLLQELLRAAGRVVAREELSQSVLGRAWTSFDRSLDMHVSNLRRKLGPGSAGGERIKTVRGLGYQYAVASRPPDR